MTEAKRSHAAELRAELKQAHAELVADKELERQELLVQSRLERRQLQHALDERNRAFAAEVVSKCDARRSAKDNLSSRATARSFTGGFVRQQNAMARQLQLGNLRRRRQEEMMSTTSAARAAKIDHEEWRQHAANETRRRADAARKSHVEDKADLSRRALEQAAARERELDMVRLKQQQLHDIRMMLARPISTADDELGGTADSLGDFEGDADASAGALLVNRLPPPAQSVEMSISPQ